MKQPFKLDIGKLQPKIAFKSRNLVNIHKIKAKVIILIKLLLI